MNTEQNEASFVSTCDYNHSCVTVQVITIIVASQSRDPFVGPTRKQQVKDSRQLSLEYARLWRDSLSCAVVGCVIKLERTLRALYYYQLIALHVTSHAERIALSQNKLRSWKKPMIISGKEGVKKWKGEI